MPSTTSSSVSRLFASSTVMTPSLPTFFIASAILLPLDLSPWAEMVPTCATSSVPVIFLARALMSFTAASTARSMPRLRSIGFMPAATDFTPSRTIAWASTVAVVVPSPAMSLVFEATSRTIWAPMFSNLSASSISLATVTPSLVIRGAPKLLSRTTLRPLGPSVTFTASARISTPRSMRCRASPPKRTSFAAIFYDSSLFGGEKDRLGGLLLGGGSAGDDAHDVGLLHDQKFLTIQLHLGAGPFAEQDLVAVFDVERHKLPGFVAGGGPNGDNFAFHRLFLGCVGDDNPASGLFFSGQAPDNDPVMQGTETHFL